jgi:hypothetical protein
MPISLRDPGNREFTTQATLSLVSLATHIADPVRRLRAIRAAAGATKSVAKRVKSVIPLDFPTIGWDWVIGALASIYGKTHLADAIPPIANVVISNIPGPTVPLYVAGTRMTGYWPLSIVEHGIGLNITLMSYNGELGIGFTVASCVVPQPQELVADILAAHQELQLRALPQLPVTARKQAAARAVTAEPAPTPRSARGRRKKAPVATATFAVVRKVPPKTTTTRTEAKSRRGRTKAGPQHV